MTDLKGPPPPYEAVWQDDGQDGQALPTPPPLEFRTLDPSKTVDRNQCILHLKLLAAFADLRDVISSIDGLFDLTDSLADQFVNETTKCKALVRIREKRWTVYTARAVDRYADWWSKTLPSAGDPVTVTAMKSTDYNKITRSSARLHWTTEILPPLGQ